MKMQKNNKSILIILLYLVLGLLWINLSDKLVELFNLPFYVNSYKGYFYVLVTSFIFYKLIRTRELNLKNAFLEVSENKEKIDLVLSSVDNVIWSFSFPDKKLIYLNIAATKIYEYELDEFYNDQDLCFKCVHPEDKEFFLSNLELLKVSKYVNLKYRIISKNQNIKYLYDEFWLVEKNNIQRIDRQTSDITENTLLLESLNKNKAFLESVFDGINHPLWIYDKNKENEFEILQLNNAARELFQNFDNDISIKNQCYKNVAHSVFNDLEKTIVNLNNNYLLEQTVVFDNVTFYFELSLSVVKDRNNNIIRIICFAIDNTNKKQSELFLKESNSILNSIFNSGNIFLTLIYKNDSEYFFELPNKLMCQLLNLNFDLKTNIKFNEIRNEVNFLDLLESKLNTLTKSNPMIEFEYMFEIDNKIFWHQICVSYIQTYQKSNKYSYIAIDISEQKSYQNKLANINNELEQKVNSRTIELKNILTEKDNILSIAAHDLKNPLTGLILQTEIIRKLIKNTSYELALEHLFSIERISSQMKDIIDKILNLNKIDSGKIELYLEKFDLNLLIDELYDDYFKKASLKKINLLISKNNLSYINTDKSIIYQILENLISNAIKYTNSHKNIYLSFTYKENLLELIIKDEGIGIKSNELPHIFNRFAGISNKPTAGESSTGLGLSIVKKYVEMLNGEIEVESKVDIGTCFKLKIPC